MGRYRPCGATEITVRRDTSAKSSSVVVQTGTSPIRYTPSATSEAAEVAKARPRQGSRVMTPMSACRAVIAEMYAIVTTFQSTIAQATTPSTSSMFLSSNAPT